MYRGSSNETVFFYKTVTTTFLNNTNLPLNVTYFFKVCAVNAIDPGAFTDLVSNTTKELPQPVKKEQFLWGIFESMFFYVGLVMLGCVVGLFFYMKRRGGRYEEEGREAQGWTEAAGQGRGQEEVNRQALSSYTPGGHRFPWRER